MEALRHTLRFGLRSYLKKVADNREVGQFFSSICAPRGLNGETMQRVGCGRPVPACWSCRPPPTNQPIFHCHSEPAVRLSGRGIPIAAKHFPEMKEILSEGFSPALLMSNKQRNPGGFLPRIPFSNFRFLFRNVARFSAARSPGWPRYRPAGRECPSSSAPSASARLYPWEAAALRRPRSPSVP
jgi:hypothetical protein